MYLHIGDNLLVKKKEIIAILDARKMNEMGKYQSFLKAFEKSQLNYLNKGDETIKSLVILVPSLKRHLKYRRKRDKSVRRTEHIVLVSSISPTTLKERVGLNNIPNEQK